MRSSRLTPDAWLNAGFEALRQLGPQALAAEPLARKLGTTKGSFYWHFKDVPAYHAAMLTQWKANATALVAALFEETGPADKRLRDFGRNMLADPTEPSLRIWAQSHADVAHALAAVDAERLKHITLLLQQLGLGNPDFARALLATLIGLPQVSADDSAMRQSAFDTMVDTVLALS